MAIYSQSDIEQLISAGFTGSELGEIMAQPSIPVTTMSAISAAGATPFLTPEGIRAIPLVQAPQPKAPQPVPQQYELKEAGFGALIPALLGLVGQAIPAVSRYLPAIGAVAGGVALGKLFGDDDADIVPGPETPVPLGGPGLPEPGKPYLIKEWHITYPKGRAQFYLVQKPNGRRYIMRYNTWDKTWKWWAWKKPALAVVGKSMPSHKMLTRLRRNLKRHVADAKTILSVASPGTYAKLRRSRRYARRYRR